MNAMRTKLKNQRGASITYALLIFLVCAVASSIVIVAGTAAAGRMSSLPQADKRYYAVTSAAGLLKSQIDGKTVVVTKTEPSTFSAKYIDGDADADPTEDVLADATIRLVNPELSPTVDYSLTVSPDNPFGDALDCGITEKVENGLLIYDIYNNGADTAQYELEMRFASNIKESAKDTATNTTRYTVTWKFHSMKKNINRPAASTAP